MDISIAPKVLFEIAGFPVTNSLWVAFLISGTLILGTWLIRRRMSMVPGTTQLLAEEFISFCHKFTYDTTKSTTMTNWLYPLFTTLALFFLASNLFPFIPGLSAITYNGVPLFRTATSDYAMIFAVTMGIFVTLQVTSMYHAGVFGYLKRFLNFSSPMDFIMGLLDIIGELAKIVSLSFRLFGNIFAGEVLGIIILSLVPFVAPVPLMLLGLLSAVIQAFIYPILVLIYFTMVVEVAREHETPTLDRQAETSTIEIT